MPVEKRILVLALGRRLHTRAPPLNGSLWEFAFRWISTSWAYRRIKVFGNSADFTIPLNHFRPPLIEFTQTRHTQRTLRKQPFHRRFSNMVQVRSYQRTQQFAVDADRAFELRQFGLSLSAIREQLNPSASLASVSRAIKRAVEERAKAGD
jgi:hypothetical protein